MGRGLSQKTLTTINKINDLLSQYGKMTLRQIYYQLLPEGWKYRDVKYVCKIGRKRDLIPVESIIDRSRPSYGFDTWDNKEQLFGYYSKYFKLNYWKDSKTPIQVWTEKDTISQILYEVTDRYRVPIRVTTGFLSIGCRHEWSDNVKVLYFGDFDPSGLWMDLDLKGSQFLNVADFQRVALTEDQIQEYGLPSVPVKKKDPRAKGYMQKYDLKIGYEIDAVHPDLLRKIVEDSILQHVDFDLEDMQKQEELIRSTLR